MLNSAFEKPKWYKTELMEIRAYWTSPYFMESKNRWLEWTPPFLNIHADTYARFAHIWAQLLQGSKGKSGKCFGDVPVRNGLKWLNRFLWCLQEIHIIPKQVNPEKVIQQILEAIRKYMPWSVSIFGNDRLVPLGNIPKPFSLKMKRFTWPSNWAAACTTGETSARIRWRPSWNGKCLETADRCDRCRWTHLIREPKNV